jgi:tetratricopeptide (TPR) repeat protein
MTKDQAVVLPFPEEQEMEPEKSDFLDELIAGGYSPSEIHQEVRKVLGEIDLLKRENRWEDIILLCHPIEEKLPLIADSDAAIPIYGEIVFALCQLHRFEEAVSIGIKLVKEQPDNFNAHAQLAFVAYQALIAHQNKEIILPPEIRKKYLQIAHSHFARAQALRPDGVTCFYRQGMLYKSIQCKFDRALPLFRQAVKNWESYDSEKKKARHQERKNYVKSLYQLSLCLFEESKFQEALDAIRRCIDENAEPQYISNVNTYYTLGKILFYSKDLNGAVQALERAAVEAEPQNEDYVFELLARVLLSAGQVDRAYEVLSRIPPHVRRPYVLWTEADIAIAKGDINRARKVLIRAAERDRKGAHKAWIKLAKLELRLSNFAEALDYANRADQFFRQSFGNPYHEALFWRAVVYIKTGKKAKAEQCVETLHAFNPYYPHLRNLRREIARMKDEQKSPQTESKPGDGEKP